MNRQDLTWQPNQMAHHVFIPANLSLSKVSEVPIMKQDKWGSKQIACKLQALLLLSRHFGGMPDEIE